MQAETSQTLLAAVPRAALHVKDNPAEAIVVAAVAVVPAKPVRCTLLHVPVVATKLRYLSSPEATSPSIVAIVSSRKALAAIVTADLAGNRYERN